MRRRRPDYWQWHSATDIFKIYSKVNLNNNFIVHQEVSNFVAVFLSYEAIDYTEIVPRESTYICWPNIKNHLESQGHPCFFQYLSLPISCVRFNISRSIIYHKFSRACDQECFDPSCDSRCGIFWNSKPSTTLVEWEDWHALVNTPYYCRKREEILQGKRLKKIPFSKV